MGYDNQPHFTPDGSGFWFTIYDDHTLQSDIWRYDLAEGTVKRVVASNPESEYSATPMPDGSGISVVRVERDSTQRLWRFDLSGANGAPLLPDIVPVGYHAWADPATVVVFVLGDPPTLRVADVASGSARVVARDVGRSLQAIPGTGDVSLVQRGAEGSFIVRLDPRLGTTNTVAPTLDGADDHAWTPGGVLLQGTGSSIHAWSASASEWRLVADLSADGVATITRIAVSPMGDRIAFVDVIR